MAARRDLATRVVDARTMLENDADAWIATAGPDGPWLVPLSPVWDGGSLWFMHEDRAPTTRNLRSEPRVRVAFGPTRDVVVIDGSAEVRPILDVPDDVLALYRDRAGSDPREWADVAIVVHPERIQAWREENELKGREIMRNGHWLT